MGAEIYLFDKENYIKILNQEGLQSYSTSMAFVTGENKAFLNVNAVDNIKNGSSYLVLGNHFLIIGPNFNIAINHVYFRLFCNYVGKYNDFNAMDVIGHIEELKRKGVGIEDKTLISLVNATFTDGTPLKAVFSELEKRISNSKYYFWGAIGISCVAFLFNMLVGFILVIILLKVHERFYPNPLKQKRELRKTTANGRDQFHSAEPSMHNDIKSSSKVASGKNISAIIEDEQVIINSDKIAEMRATQMMLTGKGWLFEIDGFILMTIFVNAWQRGWNPDIDVFVKSHRRVILNINGEFYVDTVKAQSLHDVLISNMQFMDRENEAAIASMRLAEMVRLSGFIVSFK